MSNQQQVNPAGVNMSVKSIVRSFLQTKELFGQQSRYMQLDGYVLYSVGNAVLIRKVDN